MRKSDSLAKKQEKRVSSAKAKAITAAAKAETLRNKLAEVMKAAAVPEAAHLHKKIKVMPGTAPTNSPPAHRLVLSPQRKSTSAKKRVSIQSPLCSSYDKGDDPSSDESMVFVSSRSSGSLMATTVKKDHDGAGKALRLASQGRGNPAQGRGGLCYAAPLGRGRGGRTGGPSFFGASPADGGLQVKGSLLHSTPKGVSATRMPHRDYVLAIGGRNKTYGGQGNAGGAKKILSLDDLGVDGDDSMDGSSFGSDTYPNDAFALLSSKGDSRANNPRGARAGEHWNLPLPHPLSRGWGLLLQRQLLILTQRSE
jgi:hypothetical protein